MKALPAAALIGLCSPAVLSAALTDGLVAHYKFDETSGTVATDAIRGAPGNGTAAAATWAGGKAGGAVRMNGTSSWIGLQNPIANNATQMSFSGWVWCDARTTWGSIAKNWGNSLAGQYHLGLNAGDGRLSNYLTNNSNLIDPQQFPTGSWQHVAFSYDGTTHRLYRNGVQVASMNTAASLVRNSAVTALGCKTNNGGTAPDNAAPGYWNGMYDDFGFWNRALTAAEVAVIYEGGNQGRSLADAEGPSIAGFGASPVNVETGGTTTLSWTVSNAATVTLNGGPFNNEDVTGQNQITTPALTADVTFTLTAGDGTETATATCLVGVGSSVQQPVISEFLASNDTGPRDEPVEGDRSDWIEIHNPNTLYSLDLAGYHLTDDAGNLEKWTFPAVVVPPGGYVVVFASEKNRATAGTPLHTNFKLSETGEYLALVKPDGVTVVQAFAPAYPAQSPDISYGSGGYLATPTPGTANSGPAGPAITEITNNPPPPGDADALTIRATVTPREGSAVTGVNLVYRVMYTPEVTVPMTLENGVYSAVIPATAASTGQMLRWRITAADSAGRNARAPLFRDPLNSPEYFGTIVTDPSITSQLPVIHRFVQNAPAIDTDAGTRCSLFFNGEFFDNLEIRIRGFTSRNWPKKSHKIEMNSGLRFEFKPGVPRVTEFDLNTTYTDKSYVRSVLTSELQRAIGMVSPEIFPVQVRQNAAFYSVALFTENPDKDFLMRHGLDPEGAYYKAPTDNLYTTSGTFEKKNRLYEDGRADLDEFIGNLGLTGPALETWLFDNVDLPAMANYIATTCITQNIDASDKNHYAYRDTNGSREWSMLPWDLDLTFGPDALNTDVIVYNRNIPATPACASHPFIGARPYLLHAGKYNRFLEAVVKVPRAQAMLTRRIRSLMDQFLKTSWFENRMDELVPVLTADVTADRAKWGSAAHFAPATYPSLTVATNRIKNEYLARRLTWLEGGGTVGIPAAQDAVPAVEFGAYDYNPASGNQDEEYIELKNPLTVAVDLSGWTLAGGISHTIKSGTVVPAGESLYLTPDAFAFRSRTTGPAGGQRLFVQGGVNGHLSNFGETVTLRDATGAEIDVLTTPFTPSDAQRYLVISEVMYHPEPNGEAEYIELTNTSPAVTLDLTGVKFTAGVDFAFPDGFTLAPGARTIVVKSTAAFTAVYGNALPVAGEFASQTSLSNGGEEIKLDGPDGSTIREFAYADVFPWPAAADGGGSLVLIAPDSRPDHGNPANWRASTAPAGNPGTADGLPFTGNAGGDDDADGWANSIEYALGPNPVITHAMTPEGLTFTVPRVPNADDAEIVGEATSGFAAWEPAELIAATGDSLTFRIPAGMNTAGRAFLRAVIRMRTVPQ